MLRFGLFQLGLQTELFSHHPPQGSIAWSVAASMDGGPWLVGSGFHPIMFPVRSIEPRGPLEFPWRCSGPSMNLGDGGRWCRNRAAPFVLKPHPKSPPSRSERRPERAVGEIGRWSVYCRGATEWLEASKTFTLRVLVQHALGRATAYRDAFAPSAGAFSEARGPAGDGRFDHTPVARKATQNRYHGAMEPPSICWYVFGEHVAHGSSIGFK